VAPQLQPDPRSGRFGVCVLHEAALRPRQVAPERVRVRVLIRSAGGVSEAVKEVAVTPPGLGRLDLILYLLPFLAIGILWGWRRCGAGGRPEQAAQRQWVDLVPS
jgi:hypothetical protein